MKLQALAPLAVLVLATACGGSMPTPKAPSGSGKSAAPAPVSTAVAKAQYDSLCLTCHGPSGHGDGPGSAQLDPKPRSLDDPTWQASVTDERIKKAIVFGGAAVGKSPMMPAQPQLKGQDALLDGIVKIVRGFQKK